MPLTSHQSAMNKVTMKLVRDFPWKLRKEGTKWKLGAYEADARHKVNNDPTFIYAKSAGSRSSTISSSSKTAKETTETSTGETKSAKAKPQTSRPATYMKAAARAVRLSELPKLMTLKKEQVYSCSQTHPTSLPRDASHAWIHFAVHCR
mmetsp:Transcript_22469/g.51411  ORF Transcript_22469/g.51411 Transcript_22469/m.51411 type:complete len:149 (-) Transcript_22469:673-1119(-)